MSAKPRIHLNQTCHWLFFYSVGMNLWPSESTGEKIQLYIKTADLWMTKEDATAWMARFSQARTRAVTPLVVILEQEAPRALTPGSMEQPSASEGAHPPQLRANNAGASLHWHFCSIRSFKGRVTAALEGLRPVTGGGRLCLVLPGHSWWVTGLELDHTHHSSFDKEQTEQLC